MVKLVMTQYLKHPLESISLSHFTYGKSIKRSYVLSLRMASVIIIQDILIMYNVTVWASSYSLRFFLGRSDNKRRYLLPKTIFCLYKDNCQIELKCDKTS